MTRLRMFLVLILIAASAGAQLTSGNLYGTAVDNQGNALPGVTVTLTGPGAPQVQVTDAEGRFRFLNETPGGYTIKAQLEGFAPVSSPVTISLGRTTEITLTLNPAISEQITVSAAAPVLDTNASGVGTNLDARAIDTLPTGRNYSSIVQVVPGVSSDANPSNPGQSSISVYGSSGAENAFFVDGVNTTNMEYGFQGKELNFEFIQEVDVKTGGYEAELGRSTGGIINVITKSGGYELSGDVFGYYDSDSLQANTKEVVSTGGIPLGFTRKDYG
ncbi:MAG TPA: TonB-dependent receptor, partial [Thermoanaerobaculia bacterium]|nr:TonB-dependent receptor [Thermoanaerobaculia bacterium]